VVTPARKPRDVIKTRLAVDPGRRPCHPIHFSTSSLGTRSNSATLSVTPTALIARACAAISMSLAPMGVPRRSRAARIGKHRLSDVPGTALDDLATHAPDVVRLQCEEVTVLFSADPWGADPGASRRTAPCRLCRDDLSDLVR
jgi:hypothetical protein